MAVVKFALNRATASSAASPDAAYGAAVIASIPSTPSCPGRRLCGHVGNQVACSAPHVLNHAAATIPTSASTCDT